MNRDTVYHCSTCEGRLFPVMKDGRWGGKVFSHWQHQRGIRCRFPIPKGTITTKPICRPTKS